MSNIPNDLKYTKTHEWVRQDEDLLEMGITDFAQHQLSDVTFVELPEVGTHFSAGKEMVVVESIKAAADVYAPVAGTIAEVNTSLADDPSVVNSDPYTAGWLVKMTPDNPQDAASLLAPADYAALAKES
ncbi:MAG: glycine cleavage system protein GcvH [Kiritimatiellia bacterium]